MVAAFFAAGVRRSVSCGCVLALAALQASLLSAADPRINSITPLGGKRGTEVAVQINGSNLNDVQELLMFEPGITVKDVQPLKNKKGEVQPNALTAVFTIAPDAMLGNHAIRARTASGITNMPIVFSVGALDIVEEKEPNSEFASPQAIPLGVTISGQIGNEDVDYFVVEAKKGDRISAEVEGIRLGRGFFDPYLAIVDMDRFELARSDDAAVVWHDSACSILAPADGKYVIVLRESTFSASGPYLLHVGKFLRPTAVVPAGGKPGETLEVTLLGDPAGPIKQKFTVPQKPQFLSTIFAPDEKYTALLPQDASGVSPSPLAFRVNNLNNVVEVEPNDDRMQATACEAPIAMNGVIEKPGDVDSFAFKATKGQVYEIRVHARSIRSPLDSVLTILRQSNGNGAGNNDDSGSTDSYLRLSVPADDTYVVQVKDMLAQGGPEYSYRVEVTPIEPSVVLSIAEKTQYIDVTMPVAKGNRGALMLNVQRNNWGGDLALDVQNLPKGMKFETVPVAGNMGSVPVLFSADENASSGFTAADVVAKPTDPKAVPVEGHVRQVSMLVRGQNNRAVFTHTFQRLTTGVIDKLPFKLEVIEPKVPLVKNGSMELKVRAIREKDFKAPIALRLLYNPPGTSSSGSSQIPEGKDEATIQITAGGNAETKDFKIIVLGVATVGNGSVEVASPFTKLTIGQPFFDVAFKAGATEQGKELTYVAQLTNNVEFDGKAKVQLVGLPAEATSEPVEVTKDSTEATFVVKTTGKTPAGRHKAIYCNLVVTQNGEPIAHTFGPGEIRVDAPLPPKPTAQKPAAGAKPTAAVAAAKPAAKPLSRLEMLRQQKTEAGNEQK
ncbi:MAG: PPC domain-containing protein [Planctomycetales bacterium]|nr:PPC domain-containing protein [Planctomycetales bacterium]